MPSSALPWYLKGILYVGIPSACLAALYLSIPGEVALARTAGWSAHYAPAMPVCLSVYALSAGAIAAYRRKMELPGQLTALIGSLMALILAMSAQSISHLIEQNYMSTSAVLVVAVSCVPPLTIAHLVHMAETPAQVRTASEEMDDMRRLLQAFMIETADSLISGSESLIKKYDHVSTGATALCEAAAQTLHEAAAVMAEAEREMAAADDEPQVNRKGPKKAVPPAKIKAAARELEAGGEKVTGGRLAALLGVSPATGTRYMQDVLST
ncbi:hypothetical protein [Streptomyces sp. H27-H5]|uniref:hypothetical protein n=1 Tax=Streptomyces sp. H27-H5 TaxID=2996460 RepID=UPI00226EB0DF|nr:hypothetical protein [Streptomyces sp. H27-H5]MCY0955838.1 hypothetical protein [Streptomyces sp. H27-H5]